MVAHSDPILIAMKWILFLINLVSCVYILVIFVDYLSNRQLGSSLSIPFMFNCIVGLLVTFFGFYGAWVGDSGMLTIYGVILVVNLIVGSFGGHLVFPVNLALYALCIVLAFMYAYFLRSRTGPLITTHGAI